MNNSNDLRTVGDLVAMQGWVQKTDDVTRFTLHLHLSFDEARLGGGSSSNVTFRLVVERCQVEVEIPPDEGISFDRTTVDMDVPMQAQIKRALQHEKARGLDVGAELSASDFGAKFKANYRNQKSENVDSAIEFTVPVITTEYKPTGPRQLCWKLRPEVDKYLNGPVWNAKEEPRFTVIDRRSPTQRKADAEKGFEPYVRISLRCKREDVKLLDIDLKDEEESKKIWSKPNQSVRRAAAEALLKTVMFQEGLEVGDLSDVFADLQLAQYIMEVKA